MTYRFCTFALDPTQRSLTDDGRAVDVSGRYFDALLLLVANAGQLVTKERFNAEVWRGVPVTDEALTQCIRALRRALGDDAADPRFIETVPKHGYRFIAPIDGKTGRSVATAGRFSAVGRDAAAGALGGGLAGIVGAIVYVGGGLVAPGLGSASIALALISLCLGLGLAGGLAVTLGTALAKGDGRSMFRSMIGGGLGGAIIGTLASTVGGDLFSLLFGKAPATFTGALDAAILGATLGAALWVAGWMAQSPLRGTVAAALLGAAAGALIAGARGNLMAGSLAQLGRSFPDFPLRFGTLSPLELTIATAFEGALFCACVVTAVAAAGRLAANHQTLLTQRS